MSEKKENGESASSDKPEGEAKVYASVSDTLRFIWPCGFGTQVIFFMGILGGIGNGLVYPALAFVFSTSFSSISNAGASGTDPMAEIREVAYTFMVVGTFALVFATIQTFCFEVVSHRASRVFRQQWFHSLLRQDTAFFDVHDVGGIAAGVGPRAIKYKRGIGKKFGDGIQFLTTGVGGIAYGFYASWKVAILVLSFLPVISLVSMQVVTLNQTKSARAAKHYTRAGSVAYSTVSSIKTVNALNAIPEMIRQYTESTNAAMSAAVAALPMEGFYNGAMLGSFMVVYGMLVLFGTFLLYNDVEETGCDPSDSIPGNVTCENSGVDVFGAMLGVMFAAQGVSQVGNCTEAFSEARVAAYEAMKAISRMPGSPEEKIMKEGDDLGSSKHTADMEAVQDEGPYNKVKAILPKYEINAFAEDGAKPEDGAGAIEFKDVMFSYPTRPGNPILQGLSLKIDAGKTIALVGPSGGGKSTVVSMIERFYDPISGSIELDGTNLKDINLSHLRKLIGYVGQEPTLFGTTIRGNIAYGRPEATQEEIEAAAKMANAHDFICSFPDGYDTQVGDKGSQLSGGQKQRIAIARVLVGNTKILLLDEATSALDSESELVVQDALDNVLEHQKMTTVIIAHRLSTIRNADMIAVVVGGKIVETGTHGELMVAETGYYRNLVEKQEGKHEEASSLASSRNSSASDLSELAKGKDNEIDLDAIGSAQLNFKGIHFAYPSRPEKKIFDNFHLAIQSGETVALVGPSGGGKSTTVALVERFYDPAEGSLEYMGHDIRSLNLHWYRDQIGYVGQEPILFNDSIARNIAYGAPGCPQEDIELAARQANAHSFISSFPDGFETQVGERGTQLSGGQKQRIAIARALVKKPKVLILDEATSALDSESETIVQAALDKLMESRDHTTLVIAHRLSTIRNADKIAFIADGKVLEYGSHDELIIKPHGRYKRLVESQKRGSTMASIGLHKKKDDEENGEEGKEEENPKKEGEKVEEKQSSSLLARARSYAGREMLYLLTGCVGAIFTGSVFPIWGVLFSETIDLLFRGVLPCTDDSIPDPFSTCEEYWTDFADSMRSRSFVVGTYWAILLFECLIGFTLNYVGFGNASERISKRVRDEAFTSLVRQEAGYFDMRSVGVITSELQDDAALIQAFSSVPMRQMLVALASVLTGLVLSFVFMWPFALLAMACIPVMGFATSLEMKQFLGEDQGVDGGQDELNSPGGIITETLLNMRTVSALTMEQKRYENYQKAINDSEKDYIKDSFSSGFACGMSMFIQQWVNGLQFFWGGWLLSQYSIWGFNDFLISNFALLFSMFGLGAAFQDAADTAVVEKAGKRIFELIDRESAIDPLSEEGKKL